MNIGAGEAALVAAAIFLAGLVRGMTGFAGPLIMVPVLGFFASTVSAIATSAIVDLSSNISLLPNALRNASRPTILALIGGAMMTVPLGGYALLVFDAAAINRIMYAVVAMFSIVLLCGWRYRKPLLTRHFVFVGAVSGIVLGATSFGVTVLPFLYAGADSATRGRANFIIWALFCAVIGFLIVLAGQRIGSVELLRALFLIPFYVAGTFIGNRSAGRIDDARLRKVVLFVLLVIAIAGLTVRPA